MKKNYRIIYSQKFAGETLQDSYICYGKTIAEMEQSITALYSDPHVFSARYEEVSDNE